MKRIAIVTYSLMIGGIETVIFNQAKYFIKEGYEVTIFETLRKGIWIDYFKENNINVVRLIPIQYFSKKYHAKKIAKFLHGFDVVLLHDAPYAQSILGLLSATTIVIPILHSTPNSMINNAISNPRQWNKVVCVGPFLSKIIIEQGQIKEDLLQNIPNGVVIPDDQKVENNILKNKFIYLGRLEHTEKAVLFIPDIIKKVLQKHEIEIVNIYGDGSSKDELKIRIEQLGLSEIIKLCGPLEHKDVYPTLQQHDFLLMPSFLEGHPIVLLEAMASKTIPFVSNLPGRTDFVVNHGINGFLCKVADIDDFSDKIIEALDRSDLKQISENARKTVIDNFSIDAMGQKYMDLIKTENNKAPKIRSNKICIQLLGDLPFIPIILIRPVRKALRIFHLWH